MSPLGWLSRAWGYKRADPEVSLGQLVKGPEGSLQFFVSFRETCLCIDNFANAFFNQLQGFKITLRPMCCESSCSHNPKPLPSLHGAEF